MMTTGFDKTTTGTGTLLFSGGLDSSLLLWRLRPDKALHVYYGQAASQTERRAALAASNAAGVRFFDFHAHMAAKFGDGYGGVCIAPDEKGVVRHRNLLLIAAAASLTPAGQPVIIGCNANDDDEFADCRPYWLDLAARAIEPFGNPLWAPLVGMSRAEIQEMASEYVSSETWSCYSAGPEPCGECLSCQQ